MLPVLRKAALCEQRIADVVRVVSDEFGLSDDERAELLPSGKQTVISNRVHWAKTYLKQAGLVESTRRGHFKIAPRGVEVLASGVGRIDVNFLTRFEEFNSFRERASEEDTNSHSAVVPQPVSVPEGTPEDLMELAHKRINAALAADLLERIMAAPPEFFENVVVRLLIAMGYGGTAADAGRALGKSGDDGVDGVIDQDALGLDRVYVQAKRYSSKNLVGPGAIRDFFGSLDMHKASKGLFVTTSGFTRQSVETAERLGKRIVLIDGQQFAMLMIRFNVGCRVEQVMELKKVDEDFFEIS